jgi:hypothetical protein
MLKPTHNIQARKIEKFAGLTPRNDVHQVSARIDVCSRYQSEMRMAVYTSLRGGLYLRVLHVAALV